MKQKRIVLIFEVILLIGEVIGLSIAAYNSGWIMFEYYTNDSNILSLVSSGLLLWSYKKKKQPDINIIRLKYMSSAALSLTFLVVVLILRTTVPGGLRVLLFSGSMFYLHFLCPILCVITLFLNSDLMLNDQTSRWLMSLPTLLYGIVAILCNALYLWYGPYPYLHIYEQPLIASILWTAVLVGGAWLYSLFLIRMHR